MTLLLNKLIGKVGSRRTKGKSSIPLREAFRIEPTLVRFQLKYSLIIDFRAGFFDFSFVSISNVLSAWFQYEALKLVNFTTVVLFKGSRILPVMIMAHDSWDE